MVARSTRVSSSPDQGSSLPYPMAAIPVLLVRCLGFLCIAMGFFGLTGCASFDPSVVKTRTEGQAVRVLVGVPEELSLSWVGTTVFNNEAGLERLERLNPRALVGQSVMTLLVEAARYPAVVVEDSPETRSTAMLNGVTASSGVLLLVYPCAAPDQAFQTNQFYRGVGLMQRSLLGLTPRTAMHAVICGEVIDAATRTSMAKTDAVSYQRIDSPYLLSGPKIKEEHRSSVAESMPNHIRAATSQLLERLGLR